MSTERLTAILEQLQRDCPELKGAVLSNAEGLLLTATGSLTGEIAAATAQYLLDMLERHISLIQATQCDESMVWTDLGLWYLLRVSPELVLMLHAGTLGNPGLIRLNARAIASSLYVEVV